MNLTLKPIYNKAEDFLSQQLIKVAAEMRNDTFVIFLQQKCRTAAKP